MAYTTIDDPSAYFQTLLHNSSGNTSASYTFDGNSEMQPDLVWHKNRTVADNNYVFDSTRGAEQAVYTNLTNAETNHSSSLTSFDSNGYSVGSSNVTSGAGTYASWCWKANGGTTSSNTNGTITSTVQANTDAGFSIGTFTGNGTSGATVGHGLGVKPDMLILKSRNNPSGAAMYWIVGHVGLDGMAGLKNLFMNQNWAVNTESVIWANTAPTSSVFSVGTNAAVNYTGNNMLFYAFAEKQGYSKFGKYTGAGASSPFVYTGFKPALVICKRTDSTNDWGIVDSKRETYNGATKTLFADLTNAESSTYTVDLLSNGFRPASNHSIFNQNGGSYIYMAFAENPFVTSTGIPTTAR